LEKVLEKKEKEVKRKAEIEKHEKKLLEVFTFLLSVSGFKLL
jgi:hypothetical protein